MVKKSLTKISCDEGLNHIFVVGDFRELEHNETKVFVPCLFQMYMFSEYQQQMCSEFNSGEQVRESVIFCNGVSVNILIANSPGPAPAHLVITM